MSKQVGRISGGVLKDNIERRGADLNFKNTSADTSLLHLDVNNFQIGINTENPGDSLSVPVFIRTTDSISKFFNVANFTINDSEIVSNIGNIYLSSNGNIFATSIASDDLKLDFNKISTTSTNTSIELRPDNNGTVEVYNNWNITGNLFATGDITFGGNLIIGDDDSDTVTFASDVNSDIIPDDVSTGTLGTQLKEWDNTYARSLFTDYTQADNLIMNNVDIGKPQGNIVYVSANGDDLNNGDHQQSPLQTIQQAISQVTTMSGTSTISLSPGTYQEQFPLILPDNVSLIGSDLRNTIIIPTPQTINKDVFHIGDGNLIEHVTIKGFYYNGFDNTGYAFRFKNQAVIDKRSPYVKNVSVITKGSIRTEQDPTGFESGDAGRGAYIDGSELDSASVLSSMLFHNGTFITPGADCIVMTNGVRVEWLNCFVYFANRGLYAVDGEHGRLLPDSTLLYGAELRSIGSANVYGNYGAYVDGPNCILYLIGHNFSYIGTGKDSSNDTTLVLQQQEVVELNFGKVYSTTTDAVGTFRIGDSFFANYETGETSISSDNVNFTGLSSLFIGSGTDLTFINGERIDVGNIRISGNTILNTRDDLRIDPQSRVLTISNNNVFIIASGSDAQRTDDLAGIRYNAQTDLFEGYSTANLSFGGIYSDNRNTSLIATDITNEILFTIDNQEVGMINQTQFELNRLTDGELTISDNLISSLQDTDLLLVAVNDYEVNFDNIGINRSTFTNNLDTSFTINSTSNGYAKFDASTGLVIPFGTTATRASNPETGDTRWNSDLELLETWNGYIWQRSAGIDDNITEDVFRELVDIYTLVLG